MANGVLITETHHGFVCANGGVDASNVGPGERPGRDAPAARPGRVGRRDPRGRSADRFGVDVPVIVSDSFGRPWRWGIMDVAIGVSGMLPLEDLRGVADHDGRVMRSTVRAVADEIASAAELAFGKTTARPAAIVRGAHPTRGEATIRDALIPASSTCSSDASPDRGAPRRPIVLATQSRVDSWDRSDSRRAVDQPPRVSFQA